MTVDLASAVDAVLGNTWGEPDHPMYTHRKHRFNGACKVCQGDVPEIVAAAAPPIEAAARADERRAVVDELLAAHAHMLAHAGPGAQADGLHFAAQVLAGVQLLPVLEPPPGVDATPVPVEVEEFPPVDWSVYAWCPICWSSAGRPCFGVGGARQMPHMTRPKSTALGPDGENT